jgi:hypothetical protein
MSFVDGGEEKKKKDDTSEKEYGFKNIACHVWAIDGYKDETTAKSVNSRYNNSANRLKVANNEASRNEALKTLVGVARVSETTGEQIIVYGGFRRGQNAPEHMWMEYKNKIYETMPDYDLWVADADAKTRNCPPLENAPFPSGGVAKYATFLTVNQRDYLTKAGHLKPG